MLTNVLEKTRSQRLKARWSTFRGKFLLSKKEPTSSSRESAAVHSVQGNLLGFGDDSKMSDNDLAVVRTVEKLTAVGSDEPTSIQEKEARSAGGIPSR